MDSRLVILGVFIILLIVTIFVGQRNARKESSRPNRRYRSTDYTSDSGFDSTEYGTPQHKSGGHHGGHHSSSSGGGHHGGHHSSDSGGGHHGGDSGGGHHGGDFGGGGFGGGHH